MKQSNRRADRMKSVIVKCCVWWKSLNPRGREELGGRPPQ